MMICCSAAGGSCSERTPVDACRCPVRQQNVNGFYLRSVVYVKGLFFATVLSPIIWGSFRRIGY